MKNAIKQTIKPSEIQIGDVVVGFKGTVVAVDHHQTAFGGKSTEVTFSEGGPWVTSDHFVTTVMR